MSNAGAAGIEGYRAKVTVAVDPDLERRLAERAKYERMWQHEQYRVVAPGEAVATQFLAQAQPKRGSEVIDFGAGTGRGALMLALLGGCKVHMLDFASNCLDDDVKAALMTQPHALTFKLHDLCRPTPLSAPYGFCTDVMEHIPPENVDRVLTNILTGAQHVFFQISCEDDSLGSLIGEPLHLSVHPYEWWHKKFQALDCVIHWSQDCGSHALFYVTAWQKGEDFVKHGVLNIDEAVVKEQVRQNTAGDWQLVIPHSTNDVEIMILGGGPSLGDHLDEIRDLRARGVKLITLNGTYNWALDNRLVPSATVVVDAREHNARFTHPVVADCKYLIASQVHPGVLEGLPKDRTYLWHTSVEMIKDILDERYTTWHSIPGGSTVMLRAIPMLRMLGFKRMHLFGFDSCFMEVPDTRDDKDDVAIVGHAYAQPENDNDLRINVTCGDRVFDCAPWHVSQAAEFMDLVKFMGDEIELEVYGDGLISHILATGSRLAADDAAMDRDIKNGAFE